MRIQVHPNTVVAIDFASVEESTALEMLLRNECAIFAQWKGYRLIVPVVDERDAVNINQISRLNAAVNMNVLSYKGPAQYNAELLRLHPDNPAFHESVALSVTSQPMWECCVALQLVPETMSLLVRSIVLDSNSLLGCVQFIKRRQPSEWQDSEGAALLLDFGDKLRFKPRAYNAEFTPNLEFVYAAY